MRLILVGLAFLTFQAASKASKLPSKTIVFPELLEARSTDGAKILKIDKDRTLTLSPSSVLAENVAVHTFADDGTRVVNYVNGAEFEGELYHDPENIASVIVTQKNGGLQVEGLVGPTLGIRPSESRERSSEGSLAHELFAVQNEHPSCTDTDDLDNGLPPVRDPDATGTQVTRQAQKKARLKREEETYFPELHVIFDSKSASKYEFDCEKILQYISVVINAVNLRYDSVRSPGLQLRVIGITINNNRTDESYIVKHEAGEDLVDPRQTLINASALFKNETFFQKADMVYIITGYDVAVQQGNTLAKSPVGYAFTGQACTEGKLGMCEDGPMPYHVVYTLAHETGHTLGCVHDGDVAKIAGYPNATDCPRHGSLMGPNFLNSQNQYRFSSCCVKQMHHLMRQDDRRCIRDCHHQPSIPTTDILPGDNMTATDFCSELSKGLKETFVLDTSSACTVVCKARVKPTSVTHNGRQAVRTGWKTLQLFALDGMKCGKNNKSQICIKGKCTTYEEYKKSRQRPTDGASRKRRTNI